MHIKPAALDDPQVRALLARHLAGMQDNSPPDAVFALDLSGLQTDDITLMSVWDGDALMSIGALKEHDPRLGELKSMRTSDAHLRKGAAAALLDHLIALAKTRGYQRLSLETGSGPAFEPALALYRRRGFVNGPAFGDYAGSEFNQFLHLDLT